MIASMVGGETMRTVGSSPLWLRRLRRSPAAGSVRGVFRVLWWLARPRRGPAAIDYGWIIALVAILGAAAATCGSGVPLLVHTIANHLLVIPAPFR